VPRVPDPAAAYKRAKCGTIWTPLKWEYRMETAYAGYGMWFFAGRGWGDLPQYTALNWAVPYQEMDTRLESFYGVGGQGDATPRARQLRFVRGRRVLGMRLPRLCAWSSALLPAVLAGCYTYTPLSTLEPVPETPGDPGPHAGTRPPRRPTSERTRATWVSGTGSSVERGYTCSTPRALRAAAPSSTHTAVATACLVHAAREQTVVAGARGVASALSANARRTTRGGVHLLIRYRPVQSGVLRQVTPPAPPAKNHIP